MAKMFRVFRDPPPLTDWKPGDRFTLEHEVNRTEAGGIVTSNGSWFSAGLMARAVKLPPKARPVRKGDEIRSLVSGERYEFCAEYDGTVWYRSLAADADGFLRADLVTHADGVPILWGASE